MAKGRSLRSTLILPVALVLAAFVVLTAWLQGTYLRQISDTAGASTHLVAARSAANALDGYLSELERLIAVSIPVLRHAISDAAAGNDEIATVLLDLLKGYNLSGAVFLARGDEFLGFQRRGPESLYFMESTAATDHEIRFTPIDAEGRPAAAPTERRDDFFATSRQWYREAVAAGTATWTAPFRYYALPVNALPYSAPIFDAAGELIGVIGANLYMDRFEAFLADLELFPGSVIWVMSEDELMLAASSPVEAEVIAQALMTGAGVGADAPIMEVSAPGHDEPRRMSVQRTRLTGHTGSDWSIYSAFDVDGYAGSITPASIQFAALTTALVAIVGILIVLGLVRRTTLPFTALAGRMSRYLAAGTDATPPADDDGIRGSREARDLAIAFRELAGRVNSLVSIQEADIKNQRALNARLDRLARIVEETRDMVLVTDDEGHIRWVNASFEARTGYTLAQVRGKTPRDVLSGPETDLATVEDMARAVSRREATHCQIRNYTRAGEPFWAEVTIQPVVDEDTGNVEFFSIQRDITERLGNEARLSIWARVFEDANWGIAIVEGRREPIIREANSAFAHMLRYTTDELIGLHARDLYDPQFAPMPEDLAELMAERRAVTREIRMKRSDGTIIPCLLSIASVRSSAGDELGVASVQDLSELKDLETQLRESNRLEAAGLVAGGIIHDLKNIFGMMQLSADLGKSSASSLDAQETRALFDEIDRNCERANALIGQFLFFARRERPSVEAVDVEALLDEALRLLRPTLESGTNRVAVNVENRLASAAPVTGNATQLQQVLVNLVSNATTAMQEHETPNPQITISLREVGSDDYFPLAQGGAWTRIEIRDNGPGMPPEVRSRIFEPLYTRRKHGDGTGLGLAIVQQIVDQHGGYMTCESEEGSGTAFTIWLPQEAPAAAESGQSEEAGRPADGEAPTAPGARILVVDDEAAVLRLWTRVLDGKGWDVETFSESRAALAVIERPDERVDLLITDLAMPGVNGVELVQALRDAGRENPVIVHSAYIQDDVVEKLQALAVTGFLTKPTSTRALLAGVEKALGEHVRAA